VGTIGGPALAALLVTAVGTNTLMLISAAGFVVTAWLVRVLDREKNRLRALGRRAGDHARPPARGATARGVRPALPLALLLMIALFILLMTTISTIIYFQLGDLITKAFESREARTRPTR
jgi:AAA family ATP:ADP antiporter